MVFLYWYTTLADIDISAELTLTREQWQAELAAMQAEMDQAAQRLEARPIDIPIRGEDLISAQVAGIMERLRGSEIVIPIRGEWVGGGPGGMPATVGQAMQAGTLGSASVGEMATRIAHEIVQAPTPGGPADWQSRMDAQIRAEHAASGRPALRPFYDIDDIIEGRAPASSLTSSPTPTPSATSAAASPQPSPSAAPGTSPATPTPASSVASISAPPPPVPAPFAPQPTSPTPPTPTPAPTPPTPAPPVPLTSQTPTPAATLPAMATPPTPPTPTPAIGGLPLPAPAGGFNPWGGVGLTPYGPPAPPAPPGGGGHGGGWGRHFGMFALAAAGTRVGDEELRYAEQMYAARGDPTAEIEATVGRRTAYDSLFFGLGRVGRGIRETLGGDATVADIADTQAEVREADQRMALTRRALESQRASAQGLYVVSGADEAERRRRQLDVGLENRTREAKAEAGERQHAITDETNRAAERAGQRAIGGFGRFQLDYSEFFDESGNEELRRRQAAAEAAERQLRGADDLRRGKTDQDQADAVIRQAKQERDAEALIESQRIGLSVFNIETGGISAGLRLQGRESEAERVEFRRGRESQSAALHARSEAEGMAFDDATPAERSLFLAQQGREEDLAEAQSQQRIRQTEQQTQTGHLALSDTDAAQVESLTNQIKEQAKALRDRADAFGEGIKKSQLSDEAMAVEASEAQRLVDLHERLGRAQTGRIGDILQETNQSELKTQGEFLAASEAQANESYNRRIRAAEEAGHKEEEQDLIRLRDQATRERAFMRDRETDAMNARTTIAAIRNDPARMRFADAAQINEDAQRQIREAAGDPARQAAIARAARERAREGLRHGMPGAGSVIIGMNRAEAAAEEAGRGPRPTAQPRPRPVATREAYEQIQDARRRAGLSRDATHLFGDDGLKAARRAAGLPEESADLGTPEEQLRRARGRNGLPAFADVLGPSEQLRRQRQQYGLDGAQTSAAIPRNAGADTLAQIGKAHADAAANPFGPVADKWDKTGSKWDDIATKFQNAPVVIAM